MQIQHGWKLILSKMIGAQKNSVQGSIPTGSTFIALKRVESSSISDV